MVLSQAQRGRSDSFQWRDVETKAQGIQGTQQGSGLAGFHSQLWGCFVAASVLSLSFTPKLTVAVVSFNLDRDLMGQCYC